jgi:polyhydroxyalkanoate synthesis repressor PhaR
MDIVKDERDAKKTPPAGSEKDASAGSSPRMIKRYSNRKLYDTRDSRYVTLQQIGEMVRAGEEVRIIDNQSKEDKTEVTLALIISEDLKTQQSNVPLGTLRNLIKGGEQWVNMLKGRLTGSGEEPEAAPAEEAKVEPPPEAVVADADKPKGRLSGVFESSRHAFEQWQVSVDERLRALVPRFGQLKELEEEVHRLSARIEAVEAQLRDHESRRGRE